MLRDGLVATKRVKDLLHPCGNRFRSTSDWQLKELLSNLHVLIIQAGESCHNSLRCRPFSRAVAFRLNDPEACAPGFMLSPATQAKRTIDDFLCKAIFA